MKRKTRTWWMIALPAVGAILFIAFSAGQVETKKAVTLEDIHALLVTEDGKNRLEVIMEMLEELDKGLDLIDLQVKEMMKEQGWQFEKQQWTLNDIKFLLDAIKRKTDCISCP